MPYDAVDGAQRHRPCRRGRGGASACSDPLDAARRRFFAWPRVSRSRPSAAILLDDREMAGPARLRAAGGARDRPHVPGLRAVPASHRPAECSVRPEDLLRGRTPRPRRTVAPSRVSACSAMRSYPHMLSGGEQQRVALARALAPRPGVMLMDEPFSNLDRRMRDAVREETVALLREMGATTIIVTHDPEEAMRIADRVVLNAGRADRPGWRGGRPLSPSGRSHGGPLLLRFQRDRGAVRSGAGRNARGNVRRAGHGGRRADRRLHPSAGRPAPRAGASACRARVLSRRFLGEVDLLEIAVQGLDAPIRARLRGSPQARDGADVGIDIDQDEVLVFAAPEA